MRSRHRFRNDFATMDGLVIYYLAIDWKCLSETHSIVQPLSDQSRAAWAIRVLEAQYPGRSYDTVKRFAPKGVTVEQIKVFETALVDELTKLEIGQRYKVGES